MPILKPTRMQATVLLHLLTSGAYRLERGVWVVVAYDGQTLSTSTVDEVVRNGWALYGDLLPSMQRLLHLTDDGQTALANATAK